MNPQRPALNPSSPGGRGRMATEGISVPQSGAGEMDPREYVVALSVVCRPAQTLDTMQLAFKASLAFAGGGDLQRRWTGRVRPEMQLNCLSLRGKCGHLPKCRDHMSLYQPLCVKMRPSLPRSTSSWNPAASHEEGTGRAGRCPRPPGLPRSAPTSAR